MLVWRGVIRVEPQRSSLMHGRRGISYARDARAGTGQASGNRVTLDNGMGSVGSTGSMGSTTLSHRKGK